ncbi:MAG: MBL fold metallo-hydrolase, partial [Dehalococcoidia bacterium]|nr:MBL fold metallo-hydrolase [Dehalococcoidia bacterium]
QVIHVPGHTPGSTTYLHGKSAFVGDTLFPGGPGHSRSNDLLKQEIASITTHLYALPDDTIVYPGHGDTTTIAASKAEYEVFAGKDHPADLHGDVSWLES